MAGLAGDDRGRLRGLLAIEQHGDMLGDLAIYGLICSSLKDF